MLGQPKKKEKKWVWGLTFGDTELSAISRGSGSEAYDYTYGVYPIPKQYRKKAKKELFKREKKRRKMGLM